MSDEIMDLIKSGKGLPPLSGTSNSTGTTTEQRTKSGITHETFTYHGNNQETKTPDSK